MDNEEIFDTEDEVLYDAGNALAPVPRGDAGHRGRRASGRGTLDPPDLPGVLGLVGLGWRAWIGERTTDAEARILEARRRSVATRRAVAEEELAAEYSFAQSARQARTSLALAEWEDRLRIAQAALEAEEAEAELAFRRRVHAAPPEETTRILGAALETERLLTERQRLRTERMAGARAAVPPAETANAVMEAHVSDRQVEALAIRAATRFAGLPPDEASRAWDEWRQELGRRLPPYAAQEIARRAEEVSALAREG